MNRTKPKGACFFTGFFQKFVKKIFKTLNLLLPTLLVWQQWTHPPASLLYSSKSIGGWVVLFLALKMSRTLSYRCFRSNFIFFPKTGKPFHTAEFSKYILSICPQVPLDFFPLNKAVEELGTIKQLLLIKNRRFNYRSTWFSD